MGHLSLPHASSKMNGAFVVTSLLFLFPALFGPFRRASDTFVDRGIKNFLGSLAILFMHTSQNFSPLRCYWHLSTTPRLNVFNNFSHSGFYFLNSFLAIRLSPGFR